MLKKHHNILYWKCRTSKNEFVNYHNKNKIDYDKIRMNLMNELNKKQRHSLKQRKISIF